MHYQGLKDSKRDFHQVKVEVEAREKENKAYKAHHESTGPGKWEVLYRLMEERYDKLKAEFEKVSKEYAALSEKDKATKGEGVAESVQVDKVLGGGGLQEEGS
ncbi:hypothetical protein BAUCODRAFT_151696 [Baudoinia panamericana UAMH 10762]|uniref:Uncharacterized protein n=1 Tax=Baudoinia panamericana (strain UAMH 10762) TaxID=717646 RepID=M2M7I2_BAUPA|nr:uncharacterized protein BAUCODRAFT_151696 [Baudoinia panamericana UAMH 10762]EMC92281.1 hypothetical protein BAUCODRAFT_151696 [Baudoinia panamericana UAMH 10762]